MNILVINAGSSSLKYQLLNPETQQVLAKGLCERIGIDGKFTYKPEGKEAVKEADVAMPTHPEARKHILWYLKGVRGAKPFKLKFSAVSTLEQFRALCGEMLETLGGE